jgi:miniconductance mechanosensitive channel
VFSKQKEWVKYESVQADIFDHLLAVVKEFDLRLFEYPTGEDMANYVQHD